MAQEEMTLGRRTRGRKISYLDAMPSDSDEVIILFYKPVSINIVKDTRFKI